MSHARNIKEMLSITTGSRNVATSGYSSFTDSQVFFGSQFWPENSQGASQDMSLSSRTSQQSSQEGSDPKFSNSYHTKPLLFGDLKDKTKLFGILDKFEEDKKRVKEKADSDVLVKEFHNFRETLNNIQQLVAGTEKNTAVCQSVLEKFDHFSSKLQNNLNSLQSDISQLFEALLNKVNSQTEMMAELEERVQKSGDTTAECGSNLQSLKTSLESVREEQGKEGNMLQEALRLLSTLVSENSARSRTNRATDSAIQTSPGLENTLQDDKLVMSHDPEHSQAEVPPQETSSLIGKRKSSLRGHRRRKKRPLVLSQRSKRTVPDENRQLPTNFSRRQNVSSASCERTDVNTVLSRDRVSANGRQDRDANSKAAGCCITPFSCWSQDSSSSACLAGIEPILEKVSAEPKTGSPVRPEGFWQLFDMNCDLGF